MPQLSHADGVVTTYQDEGAGAPVLLVHGWAARGAFFDPQRKALCGRFRVLTPDLRGHGASRDATATPTVEDLGRDLQDLLATLDLEGVIAVGWSMGAHALWSAIAQGAGPRLRAMVVVDMSARIVNGPDWSLGVPGLDEFAVVRAVDAMAQDWDRYASGFAPRLFAAGRNRSALEAWSAPLLIDNDARPMASLWASMCRQDFRPALAAVTTPTLIAHGALSQLYGPNAARWLAHTLPTARIVRFAESGHAPHLEEPEAFSTLIEDLAALPDRADAGSGLERIARTAAIG